MSDIEVVVPVERELSLTEFINRLALVRSRVGPDAMVSIRAEVPPDPPYASPTPPAVVVRAKLV